MQKIRQLNRTNEGNGIVYNLQLKLYKDSIFRLLNKEKCNLNPDLFLEINNTLIYSNYLKRMPGLQDSIENVNIPIFNTLAVRNRIYMLFLRQYTNLFMRKIRSSSSNFTNSLDQKEKNYSFGQLLFPEPILSEFLANEVELALRSGKWENAKLLYERHKLAYSNSPRFKKTESIYQQEAVLAPGMTFPIETLTDVNGVKLNLCNVKDKLLVIRAKDIYQWTDIAKGMESWKRYEHDYSNFQKDLVFVRLIIGKKDQFAPLKAALLGNKSKEITIFQNIEDEYWGNNLLISLLNRNIFVLGRKGVILFSREPNQLEIQNAIEDLKKPMPLIGKSDFVLKVIIISLLSVVLSIGLTFFLYRQITRRKLKQEELKRKMRELELTVIRTQMNPHFMYNCLNSIQNLVRKNQNEEAHLYLSKFASLVRQALNNSKKNEISLNKELDSVKEYIELEQLRFEFEFKLEVGNGINLNNIFVPPMLLQPFVENAILHGLLSKKANRLLEIRIFKNRNRITLLIEDNGVGRDATAKWERKGNGQGILMSTNRLMLLTEKTGIHYDLKIEDLFDEIQNPCGTRVSIEFIEED